VAGVDGGKGGMNRRRSGVPARPVHHRRNQRADKHHGTTTNLMRNTRCREPHQSPQRAGHGEDASGGAGEQPHRNSGARPIPTAIGDVTGLGRKKKDEAELLARAIVRRRLDGGEFRPQSGAAWRRSKGERERTSGAEEF